MHRYVLGFVFNERRDEVLLIKKVRPDWQAGRLNGVGGRVEATDESDTHAMSREFREETGVYIPHWWWTNYASFGSSEFKVVCFTAVWGINQAATVTDEQVVRYQVVHLGNPLAVTLKYVDADVLPNVPWLVHMALSMGRGERASRFSIIEHYED